MLAELAAANAAFGIIKESLQNGGELYALGKQVAGYFDAKSQIEKNAQKKGKGSDEFFAKEQLRQQEEELKELFVYLGRPGLWDDWLQFQADRKKEREAEERDIKAKVAKRRERLYNVFMGLVVTLAGLTGFGLIGLVAYVVMRGKM